MELNKIFYEKDYDEAYNHAIKNNYTIQEIDADENGRRFQIVEIPQPTEKELAEQEIQELRQWFDIEYARKEQKYRRLISLNKADDDGISASEKQNQLYEEAEEKRARIQELEKLL